MSISGISGSSFLQTYNPGATQTNFQQFQQQFLKLGQDLQSGNLSQAQGDFATLPQNAPAGSPLAASSSASSTTPISQEFSQLAKDLQSGNLSAEQSDYSNIQQTAQQNGLQGMSGHHHHHHHFSGSSQGSSAISQDFSQLAQDLQSGNLQSAQQAYSSLQQDFQQFTALGGSAAGSSAASQGAINITI
jgi:hypothetical protein